MTRLATLTQALLDAAKAAGAEQADAMALSGVSQSIDIRAGALEQAERSEATEIGLRVLMGGRQACVSASDTSPATLARLAERAVAMAREAPNDPYAGLADPDQIARHWDLAALQLCEDAPEPSAAMLETKAREAEAAAMANAHHALVGGGGRRFLRFQRGMGRGDRGGRQGRCGKKRKLVRRRPPRHRPFRRRGRRGAQVPRRQGRG